MEISQLASAPSRRHLDAVETSPDCKTFIDHFDEYKNEVRNGFLGKTAQFWMSYCDSVWILLNFQKAVKENNLELYITSLRQLCKLLFSAGHLNYARYLPLYYTQLINLPQSHPGAQGLLESNGFSVARSTVPSSRNAVDITIEQTINRSAKTQGGIIGFSRNRSVYYRWCLTRHKRATYVEATFERAFDMSMDVSDAHKTTRKSEIVKSETRVANVVSAFNQFIIPFTIKNDRKDSLFSISSGKPASDKVRDHLLSFSDIGDKAADLFIKSRLIDKTMKFHEPMKKQNFQTFKSLAMKKTLTSTQKNLCRLKPRGTFLDVC